MIAFWDIAPYILDEVDGRFRALLMATIRTSVNVVYFNETTPLYPRRLSSSCSPP
jgi:hypothetical protein